LEEGRSKVQNEYARVVNFEGNKQAIKIIDEIFEIGDREWRGIGVLPNSGLKLRKKYKPFDADAKFDTSVISHEFSTKCIAGLVLKGIKKPGECPEFGKSCTPQNPLGAPMVSSEGACAAYYNYSN
jgi:hydrogenase expression/formation protein HypD